MKAWFLWVNLVLWVANLCLSVTLWSKLSTFKSASQEIPNNEYSIAVGAYAEVPWSFAVAFGEHAVANGPCEADVRPMDADTLKLLREMNRNIRDIHFAQEQTIEKYCGWKSGTVHRLYLSSLDGTSAPKNRDER